MAQTKFFIIVAVLLQLLSCTTPAAQNPIDSSENIALNIIDKPASPLVTAHLSKKNDSLIINGEVHKRGRTPLNGYVSLSIISSDHQELWRQRTELTSTGLRFFGYRLFEVRAPLLPPAGSTITVEFHKLDEATHADLFNSYTQLNPYTQFNVGAQHSLTL